MLYKKRRLISESLDELVCIHFKFEKISTNKLVFFDALSNSNQIARIDTSGKKNLHTYKFWKEGYVIP